MVFIYELKQIKIKTNTVVFALIITLTIKGEIRCVESITHANSGMISHVSSQTLS